MINLREGQTLDNNKPVKVYRNLNNGQLSIMQGSKVVAYAEYIYLNNVTFHVQKAGLEKCRREKRKNVHAYAKGYIDNKESIAGFNVTYDPYKYDTFVDENQVPVHKVDKLFINNKGEMVGYVGDTKIKS